MPGTAELAAIQCGATNAIPRSPGIVSQDHWAVLAVTRFALALIIVNVHYRQILPAPHVHPVSQLAMGLGGTAAVYGFLLISGFSIAHSIQHGEGGFYRRRFARIWPVLFVGVALYEAAIVIAAGHFHPAGLLPGVRTLFFLNGFVAPLWLSPTWSLSIEVLFYIAAPLLSRSVAAVAGLMIVSACVHFFNSELGIGPYAFGMYGIGAAGVFWAWGSGFLAYRYLDSPMFALPVVLIGPMMIGAYGSGDGPYAALTWAIASFAIFFGRVISVSIRTSPGNVGSPRIIAEAADVKRWFISDSRYAIFQRVSQSFDGGEMPSGTRIEPLQGPSVYPRSVKKTPPHRIRRAGKACPSEARTNVLAVMRLPA
jgi:peptidoglycan/LPS O-acetylase OafA/YrhL